MGLIQNPSFDCCVFGKSDHSYCSVLIYCVEVIVVAFLQDYIFYLLTGYCDPPAGVKVQDGQYYNPYFPGGAIGMAQALYNEAIEYSDGTPATASQMAKDVSTFLKYCTEPEFDDRKRLFIKVSVIAVLSHKIGATLKQYHRQLH